MSDTIFQQRSLVPQKSENKTRFFSGLSTFDISAPGIALIEKAYTIAKYAHKNQSRTDGGRYFEHLRQVANHLLLVGVTDPDIIAAAFLHDVIEDTGIYGNTLAPYETWIDSVASKLERDFGSRVAKIVLEVTKVPYQACIDAEYWTADQIAIEGYQPMTKLEHDQFYIQRLSRAKTATILVKMADRLHNLSTLNQAPVSKITKQIYETETEYLPIFALHTSVSSEANYLYNKIKLQLLKLKVQIRETTI